LIYAGSRQHLKKLEDAEMKNISLMIIFFTIILNNSATAQVWDEVQVDSNSRSAFNLFDDMAEVSTNSFSSIKSPDWKLLAFTGLTLFFYLGNDMELYEDYGIEKEFGLMGAPKTLGNIGLIYDRPGTVFFAMGLSGAIYGSGLVINDPKLTQTAAMMMGSYVLAGIITMATKVIIGRARPYVHDDPYFFRPFNFDMNPEYMSMPSGHTSGIFALMTVLAKQYDSWYVQIPAYTFALSVAFQRVNASKHWASDVLVGGTLGYLIGTAMVNRFGSDSNAAIIQPLVNDKGVGLAIQF
jgi:membrane-associated phospholipid phosphatase